MPWGTIINRFIIFPAGNEPLFWFYVKSISAFISKSSEIFAFVHYFLTFILIAYLGKIIDKKYFVIIITCLLFTNYGIINNAQEIWRHTFAYTILMMGIVSMGRIEKNNFARIFIYSSILFHFSTIPIIIFFEIFCFFKKNNYHRIFTKDVMFYLVAITISFIILTKYGSGIAKLFNYDRLLLYYLDIMPAKRVGFQRLLNSFSLLVFIYLWLNKDKLSRSDIFMGTQYFLITFLIIMLPIPEIYQRFNYYVALLGSIIIGQLTVKYIKGGFIFLIILFMYNIWAINYNPLVIEPLSRKWHAEFQNPTYGLGKLLFNYEKIYNFNF